MLQLIIPLKDLAAAKSRLGDALGDNRRQQLVVAMATDLVELARRQPFIDAVTVVLGDNWEQRLFRIPGVQVLPEADLDGAGLNPLLQSAVDTLRPERAVVMHGDLPFATADELRALCGHLDRLELVLCPDSAKTGTNALAFRAATAPRFCFGAHSFDLHRRAARQQERRWWSFCTRGLGHDIDQPDDLCALARHAGGWERMGMRTRDWSNRYGEAALEKIQALSTATVSESAMQGVAS